MQYIVASLSASPLAVLLQLPIPDPEAAHAAANVPLAGNSGGEETGLVGFTFRRPPDRPIPAGA